MKRFAEQQQLDEFFNIKKILSGFFEKIKNFFKKLGFGKKFEINIADYVLQQVNEDKGADTALLGYLAEWYTGYNLYNIIKTKNLRIKKTNLTSETFLETIKEKVDRIREVNKNEKEAEKKIKRQETAGKLLAEQIFKDLNFAMEDAALLVFSIEMTGETGKAEKIKADLILSVKKDKEDKVVDKIMASLKSYKDPKLSLANNTFLSLFRRLFFDSDIGIAALKKKLSKGNKKLQKVFDTLHTYQTSYNSLEKEERDKIIDLIITGFDANYKGRQKEVNDRLLRNMGLDGSEEIYAAIAGGKRMRYVSTRQSEDFKTLFEKLQKDFVLSIEKVTTSQGKIIFKNVENDDIVVEAPISISTTGKEKGVGKISSSMKFKPEKSEYDMS